MNDARGGGSVIGAPRHDGDWEQFTAIEGQAFATARETTERSVAFYRRLGWEIAGHVAEFTVASHALRGLPASGQAVRDPDLAEGHELRSASARGWCGPIDRPSWWWSWRLPQPAPDLTYRYGWREDGRLTGFAAFRHEPPAGRRWGFDVWVSDFWATTSDALVDPARALEQSGWPMGADHRLDLAVGEPGAPPHHFTLDVAGGSGQVTPGGAGRVRIGVGAFASWFVGGMRAETAARLGFADGDPDDLAIMDMLTADRRPWLPDMF